MNELPTVKFSVVKQPIADTGVDYFGPLSVNLNKKTRAKNLQENQNGLPNTNDRGKDVREKIATGNKSDEKKVATSNEHWGNGTILITGDSVVSGLMEKKMSRNRKSKTRFFPGAKIKDLFHFTIHLPEKKRDYVILHVRTNDARYKAGLGISNKILELMSFIKVKYSDCKKTGLPTHQ